MPGTALGVRDIIICKTRVSALRTSSGWLEEQYDFRVEAGLDGNRAGGKMEVSWEPVHSKQEMRVAGGSGDEDRRAGGGFENHGGVESAQLGD